MTSDLAIESAKGILRKNSGGENALNLGGGSNERVRESLDHRGLPKIDEGEAKQEQSIAFNTSGDDTANSGGGLSSMFAATAAEQDSKKKKRF